MTTGGGGQDSCRRSRSVACKEMMEAKAVHQQNSRKPKEEKEEEYY